MSRDVKGLCFSVKTSTAKLSKCFQHLHIEKVISNCFIAECPQIFVLFTSPQLTRLHPISPHLNETKTNLTLLCFDDILDDNISMECLAANVNSHSKYIKVFPVDCDTKIADSAMCIMPFKDTKIRQIVMKHCLYNYL